MSNINQAQVLMSKIKDKSQLSKFTKNELSIHVPKRSHVAEDRDAQNKNQKKKKDELDGFKKLRNKLQNIDVAQKIIEQKIKEEEGQVIENQKEKKNDTFMVIDNQSATICKILSYYLGQYNNSVDKAPKYIEEAEVCEDWELDQIIKQVSDTNLGDFIIKCPNPDNIPKELYQSYGDPQVQEQEQRQKNYYNINQAMQFYYQLFDIEQQSKILSQREEIAYVLAFYVLKFKNSQDYGNEYLSMNFIKLYNYFKKVENVKLNDYIVMRQQARFQQNYEAMIKKYYQESFEKITIFGDNGHANVKIGKNKSNDDIANWYNLKKSIYTDLNQQLLKGFREYWELEKEEEIFNEDIIQQKKDKKLLKNQAQEHFFYCLLGRISSVSELLKTFPEFLKEMLTLLRDQPQQTIQLKKRIMFGGQYLKKTIHGQNTKWVNTKNRPNDIATLIRFSIMYELVIKSHLFVRSFLSKDQFYIIFVIKIRDEILQNYAQKYRIKLQIELGATDLFSLEPVDNYLRPLRLHNYIRDTQFIQKYNIKPKPIEKKKATNKEQEAAELVSIESQASSIYEKLQTMNGDELRTQIIQDQFEADRLYEYIAKKLNIGFIKQKILVNEYNAKDPSRKTWQLYYIYNKFIIQFVNRVKDLELKDKKYVEYHKELDSNIGMILRLMFLKASCTCNELFTNNRKVTGILPRSLMNLWESEFKLKNIWTHLNVKSPSGFHTYVRRPENDKMWRKFEINELKDRSKFFPAERLMITNKVIYNHINISKGLQKQHIIQYYPLHDPYVLKNIEIMPYIMNIKKKGKKKQVQTLSLNGKVINKLYSQYECSYTQNDFAKASLQDKLQLKFGKIVKQFSTQSIRHYCGQKIAFYFQFIKYLALKAYPYLIFAVVAQALLWKEQQDILAVGSSYITSFNDGLIVFLTFFNVFWITHLVETWKNQEKRLSQTYGVTQLTQFSEKRVKFQGSFKRNFETDELNYEYVPKWQVGLKTFFTAFLNIVYLALVIFVILLLFLLKTYLFQSGQPQTVVNLVPSVLISIASQIFTKIYYFLIRKITVFQNHKTVSEYQASLISKSSLISFIITFFSIFIFAFFSVYISSDFLCSIKTTTTLETIINCDYFLSSQLFSLVAVDLAVTVVGALIPWLLHRSKEFIANCTSKKQTKKKTKFNYNFFESIDQFYEEQDGMQSYMFNEQLDNSWQGYMNIINVFITTALFAPALPFVYVMIFITGAVRLHASKFEIIYFKRRILPIKTNSINWWLFIIEIISFLSIITNVAYMIYTRRIFAQNKARIFFLFLVIFFGIKYYLLTQYGQDKNIMAKRNQIKVVDFLLKRGNDKYDCIPEEINTDIENVIYNQVKLKRKFHNIKVPQIKKIN